MVAPLDGPGHVLPEVLLVGAVELHKKEEKLFSPESFFQEHMFEHEDVKAQASRENVSGDSSHPFMTKDEARDPESNGGSNAQRSASEAGGFPFVSGSGGSAHSFFQREDEYEQDDVEACDGAEHGFGSLDHQFSAPPRQGPRASWTLEAASWKRRGVCLSALF